jgi:hypothetical protein
MSVEPALYSVTALACEGLSKLPLTTRFAPAESVTAVAAVSLAEDEMIDAGCGSVRYAVTAVASAPKKTNRYLDDNCSAPPGLIKVSHSP